MNLANYFSGNSPLAWRNSHLLSFAEVPLEPNPFIRSLEIQRLRNGDIEGCNVVIHRPDHTVEVRHERSLGLQPGWTRVDPAFSHMNVEIEEPEDLSSAICDVDEVDNRIEASVTDSTGAKLKFRLLFQTATESGPIFIPCPPCKDPTQMRFLSLNRFRLVDGRRADLQITRNNDELIPQRLLNSMPKHRLAARSGAELLCASLCSPEIQSDTIISPPSRDDSVPLSVSVRNQSGHFTLQLDSPSEKSGSARVVSRLGQVASASWELNSSTCSEQSPATFRLAEISQDWRPQGLAPAKQALRVARRFRRRGESWAYEHMASNPEGQWSI